MNRITYETAKLASEKGFCLGSRFYFDENKLSVDNESSIYINGLSDNLYEKCLKEELRRWLKQTHELSIEISIKDSKYKVSIFQTVNDNLFKTKWEFSYYNTYEEALEKGLFTALTKTMVYNPA